MSGDTTNGTATPNDSTQKVKSSRNPFVRLLKGLVFAAMPLITWFIVAGLASSLLHPLAGIVPAVAGIIGALRLFLGGLQRNNFQRDHRQVRHQGATEAACTKATRPRDANRVHADVGRRSGIERQRRTAVPMDARDVLDRLVNAGRALREEANRLCLAAQVGGRLCRVLDCRSLSRPWPSARHAACWDRRLLLPTDF